PAHVLPPRGLLNSTGQPNTAFSGTMSITHSSSYGIITTASMKFKGNIFPIRSRTGKIFYYP
ncbi:MAG TPA: hypothetical protein PKJ95_07735, partial [Atribacterota bacterium]|nr:hypothetical protein [Atribacterota bacterium]